MRYGEASFQYLGSGRSRAVWRHGNYVVKIPLNEAGIHDNIYERSVFQRRRQPRYDWGHWARCRLLGDILIMQYVDTDSFHYADMTSSPAYDWTYAIDGLQVGYNRFGQLVAYDYGWN